MPTGAHTVPVDIRFCYACLRRASFEVGGPVPGLRSGNTDMIEFGLVQYMLTVALFRPPPRL